MNTDVFILFFNSFLTTVLSVAAVVWILRKQYLPVIKQLEQEEQEDMSDEKHHEHS
ncbi:hypothetical protein B0H94_11224 [Salsuginibacillus halophilus]|uniref:Uncharacterized protein n=1 Tax=Salsuginibacillus halophilus TaxID=517424 RepID=A0A2P8H9R8_9BACI|nr:hypothetical protein [Salsuginibacillus halophilus]PSL42941.1 hypothetical protein B0H94_11224 [Salsuginibacillus halophilus]